MDCNDTSGPADRNADNNSDVRRPWTKPVITITPVSATAGGLGSTCETTSVSNASQSS